MFVTSEKTASVQILEFLTRNLNTRAIRWGRLLFCWVKMFLLTKLNHSQAVLVKYNKTESRQFIDFFLETSGTYRFNELTILVQISENSIDTETDPWRIKSQILTIFPLLSMHITSLAPKCFSKSVLSLTFSWEGKCLTNNLVHPLSAILNYWNNRCAGTTGSNFQV